MKNNYIMLQRSCFAFLIAVFFLTFSVSLFAQQSSGVRQGVIRVKVSEELAAQLENLQVRRTASNIVLTGISSIDAVHQQYKVTGIKRVFRPSGKFEAKHRRYGLHRWYEIEMDKATPVLQALAAYQTIDRIEQAEPVYEKTIIDGSQKRFGPLTSDLQNRKQASSVAATLPGTSNDPFLSAQWHYNNTGQTGGTPGADIKLLQAWGIETGSSEVIVAVTDGGIQVDHPDLIANMWINTGEIPGNNIDDDNNGFVDDINGYGFGDDTGFIAPDDHGTHVGGTVAATTHNGIGVAGVAGGSGIGDGARLMSCAAFGANDIGGFEETYVYAADNGAIISQNSWGYTLPRVSEQVVLDAIDYFIAEAGKDENGNQVGLMNGGIVIFAAGNDDSNDEWYPGFYDATLAVAATTHEDKKAYYSNYGPWVDIAAPGGETINVPQQGIASTVTNNQYGFSQGTSMACPHVSGAAALILSRYGGGGFTPEMLRARLVQTTDNIDAIDPEYAGLLGSGRLNAFAALQENDNAPPFAVNDLSTVDADVTSVTLTWTAPADPGNGSASFYDIRYSTSPIDSSNFDEATPVVDTPTPQAAGTEEVVTITGLAPGTTYYFALVSADFFGNTSALSNVVEQSTDFAPAISVSPDTLTANLQTAQVSSETLSITNTGQGLLQFIITSEEEGFATPSITADTLAPGSTVDIEVMFDANNLLEGTYAQNLIIHSNDPVNDTLVVPLLLHVINNGAPIASVAPDTVDFGGTFIGGSVDETVTVHNAGSDTLDIISVTSDNPDFSADFSGITTVAPFEDVPINVSFSPSTLGISAGVLTIVTNDPVDSVFYVALLGEGLEAPGIEVTPDSLYVALNTGNSISQFVTVENTGASNLEITVNVTANSPDVFAVKQIELPSHTGTVLSGAMQKQKASSTFRKASHVTLKSVKTLAAVTRVLILTPDDDVSDLASILNGFGDIEATVFPQASLPSITLADVASYDVIMTTNNTQWLATGGVAPAVIGDLLADYIDQGGKVIANEFAYSYDAWRMEGRFITDQYGPFTPSTTDENIFVELGTVLAPNHRVMQGVDSLVYSGFVQNVGLAPGATALATWENGELFAAANNNVVALNLLPSLGDGNPLQWEGDLPTLYQNAIHWLAGPPFIEVSPQVATILPGEQIELEVTFDASGLAGGFYESFINIHSNAPGSELVFVSALLEVLGPEFTVTPDSLVEELEKGETSTRTLVLQNNGTGDHSFEVSVRNAAQNQSVAPVLSVVKKSSRSVSRVAAQRRQDPFSGRALDLDGTRVVVNDAVKTQRLSASLQETIPLYTTDFENFALGDITDQEEWFGQFGNWVIETANASSGVQHIRSVADGLGQTLAFSPQVAIGTEPKSTTTMKLNVQGTGVTWQVIPQSPTAGFLNTRIQFGPDGSVTALVSDGAGEGFFVPIEADLPSGYFDLTIEVDRTTAIFDVYFNTEKVFTGQGFAGDIEQVVLLSLMEVEGPILDVDDFQILDGQKEFTPPFISVSPVSGNLGAGESVEITVTFDATELEFGTYFSDIIIDIAGVQQLDVLAILTVVGDPAMEVDPTVLQAVVNYKEDTIKNFEIRNTGGRPLDFSMQVIGAETDLNSLPQSPVSRFASWQADERILQKMADDERLSVVPKEKKEVSVELLIGTALLQENFEGAVFPPAGWSVVDNEGSGVAWGFAADTGEGNYSGTGEAATVSSDAFGEAEFDTEIISPVINTGGFKNIAVQFNANYQNFANLDFFDVDLRVAGDTSWINVLRWNEDHGTFRSTPGEFVTIMLDEHLAGATSFQLRWHYYDPNTPDWDWYAQIDDVVILGDPRAWLSVSPASGTVPVGEAANIAAHFDAEDVEPGFYVAGTLVRSNAVKNPLVGVVASLEVQEPAEISVAPDSIYQELMVGESATQSITITNSGESVLRFSIGNAVKASVASAPKERLKPTETRTTATKTKLRLDDPSAIRQNGVTRMATSTLYATGFEEFAPGDINAQEGWAGQFANWTVENNNAFEGAQHFRGLADGLGQSLAFSPEVTIGSEPISSAVMMINLDNATTSTWQIIPQSITAELVNTRFQVSPDGTLQALVQDSLGAVLENINATAPSGYFEFRIDVERATALFTIFFNGEPVFTGQGFAGDIEQVVILSLMETDGPTFDIDNFAILDGAPQAPWLVFDPASGIVPSGSSVDVTLTFNASDLEEGIYTDELTIASNDPDEALIAVPVVFNVMDNDPPVLGELNDVSVIENGSLDLTFTATDEDDSLVTVTLVSPPTFVTLTSSGNGSASYSVNPKLGDAGAYRLTVFAEDARGEFDSASFLLTVVPYGVEDFSLINASTGEVVLDFDDSVTVDVADPDFLRYVIQANTNPKSVGSVVFNVNGKKINTANQAPYQLSRLVLPLLGAGTHKLSAEAFTRSAGRGDRGKSEDAVIHIVNSATITGFEVVNTRGQKLMDLTDGGVIDIKPSAFRSFTIVANASGAGVLSVRFELNGKHIHTNSLPPYAMTGDLFGYFLPWSAKPGTYTLTATPYSSLLGLGIPGEPVTITFDVVRGGAAARNGNARMAIEEENGEASFAVYPVPVKDELNIQTTGTMEGEVELIIHNTQGQLMYQHRMAAGKLNDFSVSTNAVGMSKGVYYLQVIDAKGQRQIRKIIKE